jgi:hypothetical protein
LEIPCECGSISHGVSLLDSNILVDIKFRGLEWLGYIRRMECSRVPKIVLNIYFIGKRNIDSPRFRWFDDFEANFKRMGIRNW